jgi:putative transposase
MKPGQRCHVVVLPLCLNAREAAILRQRLRVRGQLRNAALQTMLARSERMRADPRFAAAGRLSEAAKTRRYRALRDEYGLSKREACNAAFGHWRASRWMPTVVDSRVALELGTEVWQQVSAWLHGKGGRPRFRRAAETDTVWGADNHAGLCLRGRQVVWRNKLTRRKNLSLTVECDPGQWRKRVAGREVVRVGIRREQVRGQERWFCLLCLAGEPYRDPDYLAQAQSGAIVGIDAGPSRLALVSADASATLTLCPEELLAARRREQQRLRRRQRALARSRRATNPDSFDERGRWKKGHRALQRSRRYQRLARRQRAAARTARLHRRGEEMLLAREIVTSFGAIVVQEALRYRAWQRFRFGKRMGVSAPASALARIAREAERVGGRVIALAPALALSQHCLCGSRVKKRLETRVHACAGCGLGPLDRDLFSAFLAYLCAKEGISDLSTGTLNGAGHRRKAQALCAPGRAPVPARFGGRQADAGRLARKASVRPRDKARPRGSVPAGGAPPASRLAGPS